MMAVREFHHRCLTIAGGNPYQALAIAIRITRWQMIANLELWPEWDEPLPLEVRHARDEQLARYAA